MIRQFFVWLGAVVALVALAGCQTTVEPVEEVTMMNPELLEGRWQVTQINGPATLPKSHVPFLTIEVEEGRVHGNDGCNSFFGNFTVEGDVISVGPLGGTLMACKDPSMAQTSQAFTFFVQRASRYVVDETSLVLMGPEGSPLINFKRSDIDK